MANVIRRGVRVRYVGSDARLAALWGNWVCRVEHRCGDWAVGYFPELNCGRVHLGWYSVPVRDLEIVNR